MSDAAFELQQVLALARSQHPDPTGWSLAVNVDWLERADFGVGAVRQIEMLLSGAPAPASRFGDHGPTSLGSR